MTTRVLVYEPESTRGEVRELAGEPHASLDSMQRVVGGHIETALFARGVPLVAILNEEGLLEGLPDNQCAAQFGWVGTFFVVRIDGPDFVSLTPDDEALVRRIFDQPVG
jgi:Domain of unknown function (DUF3846)